MENGNEILEYALNAVTRAGAEKVLGHITETDTHELNVESGEMSLLRTTLNRRLNLTAHVGGRKGTISVSRLDRESIDTAAGQVVEMANSAVVDEANAIAEAMDPRTFKAGMEQPEIELMYSRMRELVDSIRAQHPKLLIERAALSFHHWTHWLRNTNGVRHSESNGYYAFTVMFASKDGKQSSSFNHTYALSAQLDRPLLEWGNIRQVLAESESHLNPRRLSDKFTGKLLISPQCLSEFIYYLTMHLRDGMLINGTSLFRNQLETQIVSSRFTLRSCPFAPELAEKDFLTTDGYPAQNSTVIDRGVLKTYLLSLYGARKTGYSRAVNNGSCWIVEPGDTPLDEMIRGIDRGILLQRFSGDSPNSHGDFSGVAKNSFYIENGEVKEALTETMISGNLRDLFSDIISISRETLNSGGEILPYMLVDQIMISG